MFTRKELNVLQSALRAWQGPYRKDATLNKNEQEYKEAAIKTANDLAERFEGILWDYYELERSFLDPTRII